MATPLWPLRGLRREYRPLNQTSWKGGQGEVWSVQSPDGSIFALKAPISPATFQAICAERQRYQDLHRRARPNEDRLRRLNVDSRIAPAGDWLLWVEDQEAQGSPFFVMPLFDGDLGFWLTRESKPPLGRRLRALELACAAVGNLHRLRDRDGGYLIHRDIKPDNFLVRANGEHVVLADLGGVKEGRGLPNAKLTA
ncbi:MAG TPA: hypothetical protein PLA94_21160, partial [Myxococcota bacterium]|nr:hypothetical protein [Myxococcota bacterium]